MNKTKMGVAVIVLLSALAGAALAQAKVQIHVSDAYGNSVTNARVRLISSERTQEIAPDQVLNVGFGTYALEVWASGASPFMTSVLVDQFQQILTVALKLGPMEGEINPCSVVGDFAPTLGLVRLRLVQLFGPYLVDVPIKSEGKFEFRNLVCGEYLLIAMSDKKCLLTAIVTAKVLPPRHEFVLKPEHAEACGRAPSIIPAF